MNHLSPLVITITLILTMTITLMLPSPVYLVDLTFDLPDSTKGYFNEEIGQGSTISFPVVTADAYDVDSVLNDPEEKVLDPMVMDPADPSSPSTLEDITLIVSNISTNLVENDDALTKPAVTIEVITSTMSPLKFQVKPSDPIMTGATTTTTIVTTSIPHTTIRPSYPFIHSKHCGVRPLKPQGRVVGGRNAYFGEWPWQVLIKEATWLGLFVKTKCGGVLIDHKWVLTAAHCQPGFLGSLVVIVGEYDLTGDFEKLKPVAKQVKRMIIHRNYNADTFENDIALLELESKFEMQPHVIPICLPENEAPDADIIGKVAHVAGWGKLSYGGPVPSILQVVKLPIIPATQCQKMFLAAGHHKVIKNTFLCAGYNDGGKDSCEGDSGGPLMIQGADGRWSLIGTVSHGIKCAEPNLPGVYMKTSAYIPWIHNIILAKHHHHKHRHP